MKTFANGLGENSIYRRGFWLSSKFISKSLSSVSNTDHWICIDPSDQLKNNRSKLPCMAFFEGQLFCLHLPTTQGISSEPCYWHKVTNTRRKVEIDGSGRKSSICSLQILSMAMYFPSPHDEYSLLRSMIALNFRNINLSAYPSTLISFNQSFRILCIWTWTLRYK